MKTKNYISLIFAFVLLSITSCENFLDESPKFALTEGDAITDFSKAQAAVGGIYSTFQNDAWAGALYIALASKAGFVNFSDADYRLSYNQSNHGGALWSAFYKSLNAANFAVNAIPNLPAESVPSEEERNALIGEARGLRAWINANILWNYGHWWADDNDEYGLIYRDQVTSLDNIHAPRLSVGESYGKIYEDLDYAIEYLPDFTSSRYFSKQFAKTLKAKLLLYRGGYRNTQADLEEALVLVNDVLQDHPSTLALESDLEELYSQSWDSKENLFARYLEDNGSRTSYGGYWYTYGIIYQGNALPLSVGGTLTAGLRYGLDWFTGDGRWEIATGEVRAPETWDETYRYTFKKLARLGSYAGKQASPPDEKYAAYYLRLAELYLLKAELLARTGASAAEAIAPINELRAKRTNPTLPALSPANEEELYDLIFKEIFLELILENGSEFFAALRFQKDGKPWIVTIKDGVELEENRICYPIPDSEIINNPLAKQNPDLQ